MKKDQAVDILQTLMPKDIKRKNRADKKEALELAIEALGARLGVLPVVRSKDRPKSGRTLSARKKRGGDDMSELLLATR